MVEFNESRDVLETKHENLIREELQNYVDLWRKFTALQPCEDEGLTPYEVETPENINPQEVRKDLLELHTAAYSLLANLIYAKKQADRVPEKVSNNEEFLDAWDKIEMVYLRLGNVRLMWGKLWQGVQGLGYSNRVSEGNSINCLKDFLLESERTHLLTDNNEKIGDIDDIVDRRNHLVHYGVRAIWTSENGRLAITEEPTKGESWIEESRAPKRILAKRKVRKDVKRVMEITNELIGVFISELEKGLKERGVRIVS